MNVEAIVELLRNYGETIEKVRIFTELSLTEIGIHI
jgi:hypothetical protein